MDVPQKKILVVDDEKPMTRALEIKLKLSGFDVRVAYNGEEALKFLESEKFDLVLLDLIMPKLDGFGVLSAMKTKDIRVPVVVASNLGQEEDIARAKAMGAIDYFVKSDTSITEIVVRVNKDINLNGQ
ncbi:MAG: hypothetical protein A3B23_03000 [Candidatus Colwellbacteria bacterium RIFCSPLOWO2_01_FULL_48_10]|uniref:Response regulatory domain-containing protein n=2 Tax=Bacteria candidate phyla TaxID=1783234 RepID=A0A1F5P3M2_9BACT|nr:MAG: hypothetical protein A2846_02285 [Candidatus Doudnabacteria bacterium RIFCSPHIGHO2_01_FULL_49_9]OGY60019.1 MAG: hypothetical protein A3B23_03000 [Candidatus Colwellbacteria bacterium RIFCSPLOWO2_01_FULL_48_10]